jgi:hypothetical protein
VLIIAHRSVEPMRRHATRDRRLQSRLPHVLVQFSAEAQPCHAAVGRTHEVRPDADGLSGRVKHEHIIVAVKGQAILLDGGRGIGRRGVEGRELVRRRRVQLALGRSASRPATLP